ncbi:GSKIP family protein [Megaselia abdita]
MGNPVNPHKNRNPYDSDEDLLSWEDEAGAIIRDVKKHVKQIFVSECLPSNSFEIYINIETLESSKYCIRSSGSGFQIAGDGYDNKSIYEGVRQCEDEPEIFETPYSLLSAISPLYNNSFAQELQSKLQNL